MGFKVFFKRNSLDFAIECGIKHEFCRQMFFGDGNLTFLMSLDAAF